MRVDRGQLVEVGNSLRAGKSTCGSPGHNGAMTQPTRVESRRQQWQRRSRTIPIMLGLTIAAIAVLPVIVVGSILWDLARGRRRLPTVRVVLFLLQYGINDSVEILLAPLLWMRAGLGTRVHHPSSILRHQRLARWSLRLLLQRAEQMLGLTIVCDQASRSGLLPAPAIVLCRHVSLFDASLPSALYLEEPVDVRGVVMAELLADPGFDLLYGRLGSVFIPRDNGPDARDRIARFGGSIDASSVAVIFPEGRLFRRDVVERSLLGIARTDVARAERLRALRHLLPPRIGGFTALLDACPGVDVVVIFHTGLEDYGAFRDLARDVPLERPVTVEVRRFRRSEIPEDDAQRARWLDETWLGMDAWVDERLTTARRSGRS